MFYVLSFMLTDSYTKGLLLNASVDLQQKDQFGFTALHLAAVKAPVEVRRYYTEKIFSSLKTLFVKCIRLLLNAGADVNVEDAYNKVPTLVNSKRHLTAK